MSCVLETHLFKSDLPPCLKLANRANQEDAFEWEDSFLHCPRQQRTAHRPCDQATCMMTRCEADACSDRHDLNSPSGKTLTSRIQPSDPVIAKVE